MRLTKQVFRLLAPCALLLPLQSVSAASPGYPTYPDSTRMRGERWQAEYSRHSDSAWAKALPIVEKQAKEGRPYRPWASKPEDLLRANIPAFPGAEGGGAYTQGGRGGRVMVVTTLADSGPGSFREACETGGARVIVFNVAGVIRLKSPISIRAPYVTIAGQTAPGDGVCITGHFQCLSTPTTSSYATCASAATILT